MRKFKVRSFTNSNCPGQSVPFEFLGFPWTTMIVWAWGVYTIFRGQQKMYNAALQLAVSPWGWRIFVFICLLCLYSLNKYILQGKKFKGTEKKSKKAPPLKVVYQEPVGFSCVASSLPPGSSPQTPLVEPSLPAVCEVPQPRVKSAAWFPWTNSPTPASGPRDWFNDGHMTRFRPVRAQKASSTVRRKKDSCSALLGKNLKG